MALRIDPVGDISYSKPIIGHHTLLPRSTCVLPFAQTQVVPPAFKAWLMVIKGISSPFIV
jgi:hypothetical protein